MKKYCFLLLVFVTGIVQAESEGFVTQSFNIGTVVVDSNIKTSEWDTVKTIKVSEQNQNDGCGFLCTKEISIDNVTFLGKGRATIKWLPDGEEKTVNTVDGDMKIRLIYKDLKVRASSKVVGVGYQRTYIENFDVTTTNNMVTKDFDTCNSLYGQQCRISFMSGLVDGEIDIQVKLPPALSKKNYELKDVQVGSFENTLTLRYVGSNISDTTKRVQSQLFMSGYVSVPDRCYLLIDNVQQTDSSAQNITFKDVEADKVTGGTVTLDSKTLQLRSQCLGVVGASKAVQLDAKLTPVDMTVENGYVFKLNPKNGTSETGTSRYLGVVARLLPTGRCNNSDNNALKNGVYIPIGQVVIVNNNVYMNGLASPVPLTFSLCSFGDGGKLLAAGEHTGALKLTSRWRFE